MTPLRLLILLIPLLLSSPGAAEQHCNPAVPRTTPTERFIVNDDATVTDRQTGLTWKRCAVGRRFEAGRCRGERETFSRDQAIARFGTADADGWRLPWIKELASIVERGCWNPAINREVFPDTPPAGFWSMTVLAADPDEGWYMGFQNGKDEWAGHDDRLRVRLVRP